MYKSEVEEDISEMVFYRYDSRYDRYMTSLAS